MDPDQTNPLEPDGQPVTTDCSPDTPQDGAACASQEIVPPEEHAEEPDDGLDPLTREALAAREEPEEDLDEDGQPKKRMNPFAFAAVVISIALAVSCVVMFLSDPFNTQREGIFSSGEQVSDEAQQPISYALIHEQGSQDAEMYQLCTDYLTSMTPAGQWVSLGLDISSQEQVSQLSDCFIQALYDNPTYATPYPMAPINASGGGVSVWVQDGQFKAQSLWQEAPSSDYGAYRQQICTRAQQIHDDAISSGASSQVDYVVYCFKELACSTVYSEDDDQGAWYANDVYGALLKGESECYGMSCALKACLDLAGIPNFIADGESPQGGHAWNMVYIDDSWYVCDMTWGALDEDFDGVYESDPEISVQIDGGVVEHRTTYDIDPERLDPGNMIICNELGCLINAETYLNGGTIEGSYYDASRQRTVTDSLTLENSLTMSDYSQDLMNAWSNACGQ